MRVPCRLRRGSLCKAALLLPGCRVAARRGAKRPTATWLLTAGSIVAFGLGSASCSVYPSVAAAVTGMVFPQTIKKRYRRQAAEKYR